MTAAQILAVTIFVVMFVLIVLDKIERHYVTLGCGFLTVVGVFGIIMRDTHAIFETLNLRCIFTLRFWYVTGSEGESTAGINWATIIFIAGMMIMVEGMAKAGFFRWLCMLLAKAVNYKPIPLFVAFMIMSAGLAMFIDSITVILFLVAVTIELAKLLKFNPIPMVLSEIFCANLGGSATMCGDPPNIIIGTSLGYSFGDFITNTGIMAGISLVIIVFYFLLVFYKDLKTKDGEVIDISSMPTPREAISDKREFAISSIIFACAVILLVTHEYTGLTVAFIGTSIAVVTLITSWKYALELLKKVDYKTLLFFIGLFMVEKWMPWLEQKLLYAKGIQDKTGIRPIVTDWEYNENLKKLYASYGFGFLSLKKQMFENISGCFYGLFQAVFFFLFEGTGKQLLSAGERRRRVSVRQRFV